MHWGKAQDSNINNSNSGSLYNPNPPIKDGEVQDEELDEYKKALVALLGDKITGPEILEKNGKLLERCLGTPLDEKVVKQKCDAFPISENIANLKVPRTNPEVFNKASVDRQNLDRGLQLT